MWGGDWRARIACDNQKTYNNNEIMSNNEQHTDKIRNENATHRHRTVQLTKLKLVCAIKRSIDYIEVSIEQSDNQTATHMLACIASCVMLQTHTHETSPHTCCRCGDSADPNSAWASTCPSTSIMPLRRENAIA